MIPVRPRVATNANASGTPAKLEATPENVISIERSGGGKSTNRYRICQQKAKDTPANRRHCTNTDA